MHLPELTITRIADFRMLKVVSLLGAAFILFAYHAPVLANDYLVERIRFVQARKYLQQNEEAKFLTELKLLGDYPIQHYLRYQWLLSKIARGDAGVEAMIMSFVQRYSNSHLAPQLIAKWQRHLFAKGRWQAFIDATNHPRARSYPCRLIEARLNSGRLVASQELLRDLWQNQPVNSKSCRSATSVVLASVTPTASSIWERIDRLMRSGRWRSAREMKPFLNNRDKALLALWIDAYRNPGDNADNLKLQSDTSMNRRIVLHQHKRWSRFAAAAADSHWQAVRNRYSFTPEQRLEVDREIALRGRARLSSSIPRSAERIEYRG